MKAFYILLILLATLLPSKAIQYVVQTDGSNYIQKPSGFWNSQPYDFMFSNAVNTVVGNSLNYLTNGLATTNYVISAIQAATNGISFAQVTNLYLTAQNNSGGVISNGSAVTITSGTGSLPRIVLAQASTNINAAGYDAIGVASGDIANGGQGLVCVLGTVGSVATDGWITGSTLWLSTNAGALTTNPPPYNYAHVIVGVVARANSNNGVVFVQPQQAVHFGDIANATNIVISIANAQGYLTSIPVSATNQFLTSVPVSATNWIVIQSTNGFLSNADTNTLKAQAGAAIAGSNYLVTIPVSATNQFTATNDTTWFIAQANQVALTNGYLRLIPTAATNQFTATNDTTWFVSRTATNGLVAQNGIATNVTVYGNGNTLLVSNNAQTIVSFESNTNNWSEIRVKNRSSGMAAQSVVTVEADNGTPTSYYSSLNMNSSTYTNGSVIWPYGTNWSSWTTVGNPTNYADATRTVSAAIGVAQTNSALIISVGNGFTRTNVTINDSGINLVSGTLSVGGNSVLTNIPVAATNQFVTTNAAVMYYSVVTNNSLTLSNSIILKNTNGSSQIYSTYQPGNTISRMNILGDSSGNNSFIYFGDATHSVYSLDFSYVSTLGNMPAFSMASGSSIYVRDAGGNSGIYFEGNNRAQIQGYYNFVIASGQQVSPSVTGIAGPWTPRSDQNLTVFNTRSMVGEVVYADGSQITNLMEFRGTNDTIYSGISSNGVFFGSSQRFPTNAAAINTADNPTNAYVVGVVYTNFNQRSLLIGAAALNSAVSGTANITCYYTNNGVSFVLPIQIGAGVSMQDFIPFSIPLSTNATFSFVSTMGTGATGWLTNVVNWKQ